MDNRLTLVRGRWYAWQMLPGYLSGFQPYESPILVSSIDPEKSGHGWLKLEFFNAFYATGVQGFLLRMKVIVRAEAYLMLELDYQGDLVRHAVIGHMSFDWLRQHCRSWYEEQPPEQTASRTSVTVDEYLSLRFFRTLTPLA